MSIKAILWDFSGVLVKPHEGKSHEEYARLLGVSSHDLERFYNGELSRRMDLGEISYEEFYKGIIAELNLDPNLVSFFNNSFENIFTLNTTLLEYIQALPEKIKVGLLSNYSDQLRPLLEEELKIANLFDDIIISSEIKLRKPDEDIYQTALERLNVVAQDTIFVDDRMENIESAEKVGMHAILYQSNEQVITHINDLISRLR